MTSRVLHTSVDCTNAYQLSQWWKEVLDYLDNEGDPNEPGDEECMILSRDGSHRLLFIEVPELKTVKNRMHLDLEPVDGRRDNEFARLVERGAVEIADHRGKYGPGTGWVVLADPEGNEFCILRNAAEAPHLTLSVRERAQLVRGGHRPQRPPTQDSRLDHPRASHAAPTV